VGQVGQVGLRRAYRAAAFAVVVCAWGCGSTATAPSSVPVPLTTEPAPAGVSLAVTAVDLGGHNVLATVDVRGAAGVQFEWFFERGSLPEVVTTSNQARYVYGLPGFKDLTVRVTLADGRRALGSAAVIVD
jgi:hypothetical protein